MLGSKLFGAWVRMKVALALFHVLRPRLISKDVAHRIMISGGDVFRGENSAAPLPMEHLYKNFRYYSNRFLRIRN